MTGKTVDFEYRPRWSGEVFVWRTAGLLVLSCLCGVGLPAASRSTAAEGDESGWQSSSPRPEIAPRFHREAKGGHDGSYRLIIEQSDVAGQHGWWRRSFDIEGGKWYRVTAWRQVARLEHPRRHALMRVLWQDAHGRPVTYERPVVDWFRRPAGRSMAAPEYPPDGTTDPAGWTGLGGVYLAPPAARRMVVELHARWAPGSRVVWSDIHVSSSSPPPPRRVRLAAVHYRPKSGTPEGNRREFAPLIAKAAAQHADLVVLPETLTYFGTHQSYRECAEPIPGPSTKYFATLARRHDLYIVAGLLERDGPRVYNVAVLIGPDGRLIGKYRKVCLPRSEGRP